MAFNIPKVAPRFDDSAQRLCFKSAASLATGLGLGGTDIVSDTAARQGNWWAIHAANGEDLVFASLTFEDGTYTGSFAGKKIVSGDRIYGPIVAFQLSSGTAVCSRASFLVG